MAFPVLEHRPVTRDITKLSRRAHQLFPAWRDDRYCEGDVVTRVGSHYYQRFKEMSPNWHLVGDVLDLGTRGGRILVRVVKNLSKGENASVNVVEIVKCPKALRKILPQKMVLKLFDRRNWPSRRCWLIEQSGDSFEETWNDKAIDEEMLAYSRDDPDCPGFVSYHHWRFLKYLARRGKHPYEKARKDCNAIWDWLRAKSEAWNSVAVAKEFKREWMAYRLLKHEQGNKIPRLYKKVNLSHRPCPKGEDLGRCPELFYSHGILIEWIEGNDLSRLEETRQFEEDWKVIVDSSLVWMKTLFGGTSLVADPGTYSTSKILVRKDDSEECGYKFTYVDLSIAALWHPNMTPAHWAKMNDGRRLKSTIRCLEIMLVGSLLRDTIESDDEDLPPIPPCCEYHKDPGSEGSETSEEEEEDRNLEVQSDMDDSSSDGEDQDPWDM